MIQNVRLNLRKHGDLGDTTFEWLAIDMISTVLFYYWINSLRKIEELGGFLQNFFFHKMLYFYLVLSIFKYHYNLIIIINT